MGDDDDGAVGGAGDVAEQIEDDLAVVGVERGGGLIADDQRRLVDQGAGDGDALLLAAGEFARAFAPARADAHGFEHGPGAGDGRFGGQALDQQRHGDIFRGGDGGDQVELLENEADVIGAEPRELAAGQLMQRSVKHGHGSRIDPQRAGDDAEQGGFATAGRTHQHEDFAG